MTPEQEYRRQIFNEMSSVIMEKGMADDATPTDRLAMAVMMLSSEVKQHAMLMTNPIMSINPINFSAVGSFGSKGQS